MRRRGFLKNTILPTLAIGCSGGIETILGPNNQQENTIIRLNIQPYATWSPSGNIIFPLHTYLKLIDKSGLEINSAKILSDIGDENKLVSHPNWEKNTIAFQLNDLDKSEIFASLIKPGFAIYPERLNFGLLEENSYKYEYFSLSPDTNSAAFSFNDEMYLSEFPPTGEATHIPVSEIINDYCEEVKMYSWWVRSWLYRKLINK